MASSDLATSGISSAQAKDDERWMRLAIRVAARGRGTTAPNPSVGCVLVKEGRLIARGWTQPGGRPHAEAVALSAADGAAEGCTAYVSLEPCAHVGRTPPCAKALIAAGVARVVIAARDPDPRVDGNGARMLREAGIEVREGVCREAAERDLAGFLGRVRDGLPRVTLKLATSLDARIATREGESKWITGEASRRMVHGLRARHDAILTGVGTILADDPMLNCRLPGLAGRSPDRVVLDSRLRTPVSSALVTSARDIKTMIIATSAAPATSEHGLAERGVEVIHLPWDEAGRVAPREALKALGGRGTTSVFIESGSEIATSFLAADLVDELVWFRAPMLIGGDGKPAVEGLGIDALRLAPGFRCVDARPVGEDVVETYRRRP
jgi:diaminohydroxyphosphoribosylaminopyrimidine deaminase/5-amino-6-(5-phosphoribosylamino)uracil reductase